MPQMCQLPFLGLQLVPKPGERARRAGSTREPCMVLGEVEGRVQNCDGAWGGGGGGG